MGRQSDASTTFFNMVNAAPDLQWLHLTSAGVDLVQFPQYSESLERGLRLSTSSGSNALPIAHTVVAAVLAHARGFLHWAQAQSEGRWSPLPSQELPRDLSEQTVIIIGMGPIGREVGRLLNTVGMRTVGIRRNVGQAPHFDAVYHYDDLDGLLPEASFVILACPLTEETRGLLNAARLARLSPSASLVNVGRGELVDEAALVDALAARRLRSAYLDVFQVEPLPADSPLWRLPNVWISPHNSSAAEGNMRRVAEIFLDNLKFWLNGEGLTNEVTVPPTA
jgi:D-2-hydroxyacid dehydrogenase (NADP+)